MATAPPPVPDRTAHPFHTYDMIHEIPAAVRETVRRGAETAGREAARLGDRAFLAFTGCGTAFYAAKLAETFASASSSDRIRSAAVTAFELSGYGPRMDRSCGVIGISHSGITKTTLDALRASRAKGARTVGVTHFPDRPISDEADSVLIAGNGPDLSRCHTKCFVAGAIAAAQLALGWRARAGREARSRLTPARQAIESLAALSEEVLRSTERVCQELAAAHIARQSVGFFGGGPNVAIAFEAALKIRETSFLPALGMEIEDFLHGSWQSLDRERLVFVLATAGRSRDRALDLIRASRTVGAHVVAFASEGDREVETAADSAIVLPKVDESLSPFLSIIPLYLFAYFSCVRRGHNPDLLRYLDSAYWRARQIVFPPGTH